MPSNMNQNESPSATLASFILGLSHQIPPTKLSTMVAEESIQRLFLERSTEALPMGSKIRNAVGSNFEDALHLLQLEIEKRIKENERPTESSVAASGNNLQTKKGDSPTHKYALMAFSRDSCYNWTDKSKRLKLCSDYASPTDFLQEKEDVLQSYKHALLYNGIGETSFVDHSAFTCAFIEQLQSDASDATNLEDTERSIREFITCLALSEVPADAASKVGVLIGRYAAVCFGLPDGHDRRINVNNVISTCITMLPISAKSIASFVAGYIELAMGKVNHYPKNRTNQREFISMAALLSRALLCCNNSALQKLNLPVVQINLERSNSATIQFNDAMVQMSKLMSWATDHSPMHSAAENISSQSESGVHSEEDDVANESDEDDEINEEDSVHISAVPRRSTMKRKG